MSITGITVKLFEIRDRGTFIPALAVRVAPYETTHHEEHFLLRQSGYGDACIVLTKLAADGQPAHCDPYGWCDRTYTVAHVYIESHWDDLNSGEVVDVEFILGETDRPKISEREEVADGPTATRSL